MRNFWPLRLQGTSRRSRAPWAMHAGSPGPRRRRCLDLRGDQDRARAPAARRRRPLADGAPADGLDLGPLRDLLKRRGLQPRRDACRARGPRPPLPRPFRQRGDARRHLALGYAPSTGFDVGERKEWPTRMGPACRFQDRARRARWCVQSVEAGIGAGLQNASPSRQVFLDVPTASVSRVVEHRGRRRSAFEEAIIAHVGLEPAGDGFAFCQHRYSGVVAM